MEKPPGNTSYPRGKCIKYRRNKALRLLVDITLTFWAPIMSQQVFNSKLDGWAQLFNQKCMVLFWPNFPMKCLFGDKHLEVWFWCNLKLFLGKRHFFHCRPFKILVQVIGISLDFACNLRAHSHLAFAFALKRVSSQVASQVTKHKWVQNPF